MRSFAIEEPGSPVPALYATLEPTNSENHDENLRPLSNFKTIVTDIKSPPGGTLETHADVSARLKNRFPGIVETHVALGAAPESGNITQNKI